MARYTVNDLEGPYTIHTTAPEQVVMDLVRQYEQPYVDALGDDDTPDFASDYGHGITPQGQPDCFYGWGEPRQEPPVTSAHHTDPSPCLPHFVLDTINNREHNPAAFAYELIELGYETVITNSHDWSKTAPSGPVKYLADHTH